MYGLDLFSGIGGITKALEGYVRPVAYCENDRYAQSVLLSRMAAGFIPPAPIWDDVRSLTGKMLPPQIDIIYGGFPCQDISIAGRGDGLAGQRSGLFSEVLRLAGEIRPRFIFLENVPAIRFRGGDFITGVLAAIGYDCRWDLLSAADVGANHIRDRWWLLAHATDADGLALRNEYRGCGRTDREDPALAGQHGAPRLLADTDRRTFSQPERKTQRRNGTGPHGKDVADAVVLGGVRGLAGSCEAPRRGPHAETPGRSWWITEPNVGRVAHGIPCRVDRLRALGNAVVPLQARIAFERLIGLE